MMHEAEADAKPQGTFWMLDLGSTLPAGIVAQVPVTYRKAELAMAGELAQAMDLDEQAVVQRFQAGRQCFAGWIEGRIATYGWVTFDEENIGELGLSIRLRAGEAYIWNCATLPAYRGQRLYPALLTYMVNELHHQGLKRIWIGTDTDNLASQTGIVLAGFRPVGDMFISRDVTMRRIWLRGRPGIPEQLIMNIRQAVMGEQDEVWQKEK